MLPARVGVMNHLSLNNRLQNVHDRVMSDAIREGGCADRPRLRVADGEAPVGTPRRVKRLQPRPNSRETAGNIAAEEDRPRASAFASQGLQQRLP
jgi:hypothetical protein